MIKFSAYSLIATSALMSGFFTTLQAQEIATWAGFRSAAASFTFDDGAPSHVTDGASVFDKYGYKGTFNLVVNWNPNWSGFQKMADNGHEIASHSNTHGQNMSGEEASSKSAIEGQIKQEYGTITVAYPNCNVPNTSAVKQNYIAGRICNGSWQGIPDIMDKDGPSDWTKVPALMTGSEGSIKTTSDFTSQMQKAISQKGWVMFLTHGFQGKSNGSATYSPTDLSAIDGALSWASQNDSKIWVTTFRSATMYVKERNASKIEEVSGGTSGTLTYKLTHDIADNVSEYKYPLSIRVKSSWSSVSATQDGKKIDASIKDGYIYFDAVPNGGNIVLSQSAVPSSGTSENPQSSSSTNGPFKGAIAIPGTLEAENYDVDAFSDADGKGEESGYRADDAGVVISGSNYALGYTSVGDYFDYTIDVKKAGSYKVTVNGATGNGADGAITLTVGNTTLQVAVMAKGDWETYTAVEGGEMTLAAGKQNLRLTIENDNLNVDYVKFDPVDGKNSDAIAKIIQLNMGTSPVKCQVFDMNGYLIKSVNVTSGTAPEVWNRVKASLSAGMYIMRYGQNVNAMQTVRVRK